MLFFNAQGYSFTENIYGLITYRNFFPNRIVPHAEDRLALRGEATVLGEMKWAGVLWSLKPSKDKELQKKK